MWNKNLNDSGTGYQDVAQFQFGKILGYNPGTQPFFVSFIDDQAAGHLHRLQQSQSES
jgi:hypothetical protein